MRLNSRREMAQYLEEVMRHAYAQLEERQRLEAETSLLKTYLIEAHKLRRAGHDEILGSIRATFLPEILGIRAEPLVHETEDDLFFNVEIRDRDERAFLYVDASNTRFWLLHSTAKSTALDPLVQKLIANTYDFDSAWLPIQLLSRVAAMGSLRGLGLDYDRRAVPDVDFDQPAAPVQFLKMQLWGNRAADVLRILRQDGAFPDATTLSKVKVKYWLNGMVDMFSVADIKYDGKITGRGTSYQSYITLVSALYRDYARRIEAYETKFSVVYEHAEGNRFRVNGEPLNIHFRDPIQDPQLFCEKVFSGTYPFRLIGVPVATGRAAWRVSAVDLHVAKPLNFELTPHFIRVYLPRGGCGNSLARLYTNLQHHYHSLVEAKDGSEESAFEP